MMLKQKRLVAGLVGVVLLLIVGAVVFVSLQQTSRQEVSTDEPVDVVYDFYRAWLTAAQSTSTTPYAEGLHEYVYLSESLRERLSTLQEGTNGAVDSVLCQAEIPTDIALRVVSESDNAAEMLVTARASASTKQARVTLLSEKGGWYINTITCADGEFAPPSEFSFDKEGSLSRTSEDPLSATMWSLLFTGEDGESQTVPLFFDAESICATPDGASGVCSVEALVADASIRIQGDMTEWGVEVKRAEAQN